MADNTITVVGNVTRDPELKFLNSGQAALRMSVAVSRRWQNRQTQEWEEKTSFFDVSAYGPMAENSASSLTKGSRVVVTGRMEQRSWETESGEKRNAFEIVADEIAPSLRWATAVVTRTPRGEGGSSGYSERPAPARTNETSTYAFDEEPF
ncbi:MAG: single-stranded DNA-binding protein [Acidimicrobiaceae bacterium]|nr:single-stranded DNA-binding protein [Acidimicrobiaceae bacterium]